MVILCGVEESAASIEAARAAAAIAKRTGDSLCLVHVRDTVLPALAPGLGPVPYTVPADLEAQRVRALAELEREKKRLTESYGISVTTQVRFGLPDFELDQAAAELDASLIVVASLGRRSGSMWRLGSIADKLSQSARVSVLIVRNPTPFDHWAFESRPLRALATLGDGTTTQPTLDALANLRKSGPVETTLLHVYDPAHEARRLGMSEPWEARTRAAIEQSLSRDIARRFADVGELPPGATVAQPPHTSVADCIVERAARLSSDLIVVGTHGRGALRRKMLGSVSFGVVPLADTNVLVVRGAPVKTVPTPAPRAVRSVLVATDFSATGKRALEQALCMLPGGGKLVLLHVLQPEPLPGGLVPQYRLKTPPTDEQLRMDRSLAEAEVRQLLALVPDSVDGKSEVVVAENAARSILETADRHGVDLVCLGTRGRGVLATAMLGSVAHDVAKRSHRPVLLVPPAAEM